MDRLRIEGLRVDTIIGVHDRERRAAQPLVIDLELATDAAHAAATDDLAEALDYGALARRVTGFVAEQRCELIETLAERIATLLREELGIAWARVRVGKPGAVANAQTVAVVIERGTR